MINQFCDRLNQDFLSSRVNADLDSMKALYIKEIVYNFNRWDSSYDDWLCKYDGWLSRIESRKVFGQYRPSYCRQHLQSEFQLGAQQSITITISDNNAGTVKLNSISIKSFPFSGIYFKNIPIKMTAIPKPGYKFTGWTGNVNSAEPEITYNMAAGGTFRANFTEASAEDFSVIINEINYCSSDNYDTKDWVELYNNGLTTVDLTGWRLTDINIDSGYVFPAGTTLIPGGYLVICRNLEDFRGHNPNVRNSIGEMEFKLSAEGEIVRLFDNQYNLIDAVNYGPISPWPADANGTGKTLELKNPTLNNSLPESWHTMVRGGTPGALNSADTVTVDTTTTQIPSLAFESRLECFPNPFSDFTTVRFNVVQQGNYRLEVLDMQGRLVKVLHEGVLNPDSYWIDWNGEGSNREVFTVRLSGRNGIAMIKVVKL
jgi:uncharacterized repeat protein (TIGR02543 family)